MDYVDTLVSGIVAKSFCTQAQPPGTEPYTQKANTGFYQNSPVVSYHGAMMPRCHDELIKRVLYNIFK